MYEFDGVEYDVGTVVAFDIGGRWTEIGVIVEIVPDGENISCTIIQPSGRRRIRTLDFDIAKRKITQIPNGEASFLDTKEWIKRQG